MTQPGMRAAVEHSDAIANRGVTACPGSHAAKPNPGSYQDSSPLN